MFFKSTKAIFLPSSASTFSFIYLSISLCELTYPISLLAIETSYCGVYFIKIITAITINATNAILNSFMSSFV